MIEDFRVTQGDRIDLHLIDANTRLSGNQAFRFLGTDDFTGRAGRLRIDCLKGDLLLTGNANGDKLADFSIRLDGLGRLSASSLLL